MVVAETEGGGAIYVRGRVRSGGHSGVPSCVATPAAGRADRRGSSPLALMVDNQPAIALTKNPILHDQSKHIDVKLNFLRDCVDGGKIVIEFVETGRQLADILTKPLGCLRLTELKEMIGMDGVQGIAVGLGEELLE